MTSAPPMLQSESASVGQVMTTQTINATPLNGRNWVYIAQLTAGVVPAPGGTAAPAAAARETSRPMASAPRRTTSSSTALTTT